ncbi:MAG: hypothetical protein K8R02_06755 [Anaerohalosphaeraceae bacterium]|nr:hypothetical protein [Anaerohalosphaeraceae bacterium]
MKRITLLTLLVLLSATLTNAAVYIPDPNLKAAIKTELGITYDPNVADMHNLTYLDANSLAITDLTGLETAINLHSLYVHNNLITTLVPLTGLTKMEYLQLSENPNLENLNPLINMADLWSLWAHNCDIADMNVVSNFTELGSLNLALNRISDMSNVAGLTELLYLNLHDNLIQDINSLAAVNKLKYLYLSFNPSIPDISVLSDMNDLVQIGLMDVNLVDISPLTDLNEVEYLWLALNNIEDINDLTSYTNLITLSLSYNPFSHISWCYYLREIEENNPAANLYTAPNITDIIYTESTTPDDMRIFSEQWLNTGCNTNNAFCGCADLDESADVDFYDYVIFADWWIGEF